ncbi:MAG TPA: hypothetical protein VNA89_12075 [Gemmatimonadaceae bacterium]|nr:hypothetical protein [Gemmatimonadaceae bacterium]
MTTTPTAPPGAPAPEQAAAEPRVARVRGAAVVYRLYDVGYEIHLDRALDLLASSAPERVRPVRGEAQALQIRNPPVSVVLGSEHVLLEGAPHEAEVSARIFDFGVVSLRLRVSAPGELSWETFTAFGNAADLERATAVIFEQHIRLLTERIAPSIERFSIAPLTEDYVVYRVTSLRDERGRPVPADALRDADVVPLLLNETRPLSVAARRELLPHRFSYYADDLAILTWDNALVVDPSVDLDTDVQFILEFANAQLLELRFYDAILDEELPRMYDRAAAARRGARALFSRRFAPLLAELQAFVADSTELVERAENSLKVTDDVYLARVYLAALEIFRGRAWRSGIDRKLAIIRDTYTMLNAESQAARSEALELAIVLLIVAELVLPWLL